MPNTITMRRSRNEETNGNSSEAVGQRLRDLRQQDGRSLTEIALKADISTATLSRIETGKQSLDVDLLIELAMILGVPPQSLLSNGDADETEPKRLAAHIATLSAAARAELWLEVAARLRKGRMSTRVARNAGTVDKHELLACVEVLHATLTPPRRK